MKAESKRPPLQPLFCLEQTNNCCSEGTETASGHLPMSHYWSPASGDPFNFSTKTSVICAESWSRAGRRATDGALQEATFGFSTKTSVICAEPWRRARHRATAGTLQAAILRLLNEDVGDLRKPWSRARHRATAGALQAAIRRFLNEDVGDLHRAMAQSQAQSQCWSPAGGDP